MMRRWICLAVLALLCMAAAGCGGRKEEGGETTKPEVTTTRDESGVVSVDTDRSLVINGETVIGQSGSYVGFRDAEKKDWTAPDTAIREGWVLQGGERIAYGAEEITVFVRSCEAGMPGKLRIQRHYFGSESREAMVSLVDVIYDGEAYYTASMDEEGVLWERRTYARFVIDEVRDAENDLLTTYYLLTDGSDPVYDENGVPEESETTVWLTADYTYPVGTMVSILVGDHDYLDFDGSYNGFSEEAPTNVIGFYEQAHEKKDCRVRLDWKGVKTDLLYDGNRYYLVREDSGVIRTFLHSCLLETQYGTHFALSATDGLTYEMYREDVTSYVVYIAP